MNINIENKYDNLKRKIYLVLLTILLVTNIFYFFYSPNIDTFMEFSIPPTCVLLIVLWFLIYKRLHMDYVEKFCVVFTSIYYLIRVNTMATELADNHINVYMFWSPIYYIFIFMVLERKKALLLTVLVFITTILMSFAIVEEVRTKDIMVQFYLSNLIYIIILFYFKKIVTAFNELDILARNAYTDHLTSIGNRRLVDIWIEKEVLKATNSSSTFSVIFFDIDHFKRVNDLYGHEVGDNILKEMTTLVSNMLNTTDYFGRWGGEEFIIIGSNRSLIDATAFAEEIRLKIEQHHFHYVNQITSSFGVVTFRNEESIKQLIKRVDEALYSAKNSGRNKVISS